MTSVSFNRMQKAQKAGKGSGTSAKTGSYKAKTDIARKCASVKLYVNQS